MKPPIKKTLPKLAIRVSKRFLVISRCSKMEPFDSYPIPIEVLSSYTKGVTFFLRNYIFQLTWREYLFLHKYHTASVTIIEWVHESFFKFMITSTLPLKPSVRRSNMLQMTLIFRCKKIELKQLDE